MAQLVETRHIAASADVRHVACGDPGGRVEGDAGWRFLPSVAGGAFELPALDHGPRDRVLIWQLQTHTTSTLRLVEASAAGGQIGAAASIEIEGHAFAGAAFSATPAGDVAVYLLFSNKCAACLPLPRPAAAGGAAGRHSASGGGGGSGGGDGCGPGLLDGVSPGALQTLPLGPQLAGLGAPSSLAVVGGHLVIAGASDSLALVPLPSFGAGDALGVTAMATSTSLLQRLVGSLYQPTQRAGVVAALPAADAGGRPLLALLHDSGALRLWTPPPGAALVGAHELLPGAAARSLAPRAALAAGGAPRGELLVVAQLEAPDAPGAATLAACRLRLPDARAAAGGGGGGDEGGVLARFALQLPAVGARLLGAALRGAALHVLAGLPGGETRLLAFSAADGSYLGAGALLRDGPGSEWGAAQDLWAAALAAFPGSTSPEDSVAAQLLVPGQLCREALRDALAFWGAALGRDAVEVAGYDQLRVYLRATLLSVSARHPALSEAQCWHALLARYCEAWAQRHAPLTLAGAGGGAWLGVVRGGPALTLLRPAGALEGEAAGGGAEGAAAGRGGGHAAVRSCLEAVGTALGAPALRLMMRLAAAGVDLEGDLLPRMADLLLYGPPPAGAGAPARAGGAKRLAEWRVARQAALLHVQQALAGMADPVQSISDYADEVLLAPEAAAAEAPPAAAPGAPVQLPASLGAALCSAVLQAARARCLAAQRLLLLLALVERMGRAGEGPLSGAQQARARGELAPRLLASLRASAMALWLVKTPAVAPPGAGAAAAAAASALPHHLEALQLGSHVRGGGGGGGGGGGAVTPRTPGGLGAGGAFGGPQAAAAAPPPPRGQRHAPEQPLSAHLLRGFCEAAPAEAAGALAGRVAPAVAALLDYLEHGGTLSGGSGGGGGGGVDDGIEARALRAGWRLFCAREFAGAGSLAQLAGGPAPPDAGLAFLLGVSLACRLRGAGGGGGDPARRELLGAASGHLFRAAAGLAAPEAAPLRGVLQQLRRRQRGGGGGGGGGAGALDLAPPEAVGGGGGGGLPPEAVPRLRLEFFEAVMRLFEAEECLEGALEFARAALGAVDGAHAPDDPARRERQGLLWMAVFTYASRLGRYADAYAAAVANPAPQHRLECVRRLVHRLAEERRLGDLAGLPFAGAVTPEPSASDPAPRPVPLAQVAVDVLTRRALHSSVAGAPAPRGGPPRGSAHAALYDVLVAWGDARGAAAAMLGLAWRLRAEAAQSDGALAEVEDAYAAALNQLELLDPSDAWLDTAHPLLAGFAPGGGGEDGGGLLGGGDGGAGELEEEGGGDDQEGDGEGGEEAAAAAAAAARRLRRRRAGAPAAGAAGGVATLAALRREAALFSAAAALAGALPGLQVLRGAPGLAPDFVYDQVLGAGRLAEAQGLAHALWAGCDLEERLERLAAAAGARCARAQQGGGGGAEGGGGDEGAADAWWGGDGGGGDGGAGPGCLGSPAAGGWQGLRALLAGYDAAGRRRLAGRMRVSAVDAALAEAPGAALPAWLLAPFAPGSGGGGGMAGGPDDAAALLRAYLRHGRLEDAAGLALDHLAAWQAANPLARGKPAAAWLPLRSLELLDAWLADAGGEGGGGGAARLGKLRARLRGAVAEHLALGARDSRMAAAGGGGATGMALG
ncbi:MAG: hypothetical protein J3K34DRAFT_495752 [Monoraphidium minutum]|nr:MAG: hypothetical protein J3K34DRAFT_495752 [Monoraphidium minutum]